MQSSKTNDELYLRRLYRKDKKSLSLTNIENTEKLSGLENFIKTEDISELRLTQISKETLEYVLDEFSKHQTEITLFELKTVSLYWDQSTINCITRFLDSRPSIKILSIRCYLESKSIAKILDHVPVFIESLDLSENSFDCEYFYLQPLVKVIAQTELIELKLYNTSMPKHAVTNLFTKIGEINKPIAIRNLLGIELPNTITAGNKKLENIQLSGFTKSSDYFNHIRESTFLKSLINNRIRVWWPPTTSEAKTMFSGRYWPAKVISVNPTSRILLVKYDNDELDHVQFSSIQPLSPFNYGGGWTEDPLENIFCLKNLAISTGENTKTMKKDLDYVESRWRVGRELAGNLLTPGEVCEFRDPRDVNSTDPSDFVAYVEILRQNEPIYYCKCIYQDDDYSDVSSCNIRRAAVVRHDKWVDTFGKISRLVERSPEDLLDKIYDLLDELIVYPKILTAGSKIPSAPFNMKLNSVEAHKESINYELLKHPAFKLFDDMDSIDDLDRSQLIKKCKTFHQELASTRAKLNIFDSLQTECHELRIQLDNYETKIHQLESQLLCFICTKSKINCIIHPCGHFQVCNVCASSMGKCPSCTHRITSIQVIKFALY